MSTNVRDGSASSRSTRQGITIKLCIDRVDVNHKRKTKPSKELSFHYFSYSPRSGIVGILMAASDSRICCRNADPTNEC